MYNLIVWGDVMCAEILNSGTFVYLYPTFARAGLDIREENLKRLLRKAYADDIKAKKKLFAQQDELQLVVHYRKIKADNYIGLSFFFSTPQASTDDNYDLIVLDLIHFQDGSPEACVWPSKLTEILANFDLRTCKKFANVTTYNDKSTARF